VATIYNPLLRNYKLKWLLADGSIAYEPDLEMSSGGRRVRVEGSSKSVSHYDLRDLVYRDVVQQATDIGTEVWMALDDEDPIRDIEHQDGTYSDPVKKPHFTDPPQRYYAQNQTVLVWNFSHETLPIAARLKVTITGTGTWRGGSKKQSVDVELLHPSTHPIHNKNREWLHTTSSHDFRQSFPIEGDAIQRGDFTTWYTNNPPSWEGILDAGGEYENERQAAEAVAKLARKVEELDEVAIPDLRNPAAPEWLTLMFHSTNHSREFTQVLVTYINSQPIVDEITNQWSVLAGLFKQLGLVITEFTDMDVFAALEGDLDRIKVTTENAMTENGTTDNQHVIGINLATGTISVTCSHRDMHPNNIATEYEIARLRAEMQGELDSFLRYESNFLEESHARRHKKLVKSRTVETPTDELNALINDDLDELLNSN
jgi:hypothetical protein